MTGIIDIKLKQHSPLIHYQGKQPGAFLSAHALKATIDDKMGNVRVGNSKKTVYSLDIRPQGQISKLEYTALVGNRNKLYFGDMGDGRSPSITVYTLDDIILRVGEFRFLAANPEAPGFYEAGFRESLKHTLAFNNFGKRGSKGFGSFWLADGETMEQYLKRELPKGWGLYKIPVKANNYTQLMSRCFEIIDIYYKNLKSGINYPAKQKNEKESVLYSKSVLMRYLNRPGIPTVDWDKKQIKGKFIGKEKPERAKMYRFRLGLAQNHEYRYKQKTKNEDTKYDGFKVNFQTLRNGDESDIARIPSPISFKISCRNDTNADILFYVNPFVNGEEYDDLDGLIIRATKSPSDKREPLDMTLASKDDLDLNELLDFACREFITDISKSPECDSNFGAKSVYNTLLYISDKLTNGGKLI